MNDSRLNSRAGFGLPATILMLIVFALLGLVGLSMARQELQSQVRVTSRETAFYAAETGLARGLQNWSVPQGLHPSGYTFPLSQGTLAGGASYQTTATMLDSRSVHLLYSVRSVGRARDGHTQEVGLLVATLQIDNPFRAALEALDSVKVAGTADVIGRDTVPPTWNGPYCTATGDDMTGILMADTTELETSGAATVEGDPPTDEMTDTTGFYDFGDVTYDELAAIADIQLSGGTTVDPGPSYNADGTCNTGDPNNWGEPFDPTDPCASWFPIIHVSGDLNINSNDYGQGLLLVDGDLSAEGGFTFFGPVLAKGEVKSAGNFKFFGGVRAAGSTLESGTAVIRHSSCVLERVFSHTAASRAVPVPERPWFQER